MGDGQTAERPAPLSAPLAAPSAEVWPAVARLALALSGASSVEHVVTSLMDTGVPALSAAGFGVVTRAADGGWELGASTSFGPLLRARYEYEPYDSPLPACRAARDGGVFLLPDRAAAIEVHPRMAEVVDLSGRPRWALLPLQVGDRLIGSLAVSWTEPAGFDAEEEALLRVFAAHCAPTVERVLAGEEEHRSLQRATKLATALQLGVLEAPPTLAGLDVAVGYRPSAEGAVLGGDWYDVFTRRGGDVVVVVGDVAGHDQAVAAVMTRVRAMVRAIAWDDDDEPSRLLDRLDGTLSALEPGTTATAVLMDLTPRPGGGFALRWASAGHPPLLLRTPGGAVEVLAGGDDPLLGVDWRSSRRSHLRQLAPGTTLVAVTDGALETRGGALSLGVDHLADALATATDRPLVSADLVCRHLEENAIREPGGGPGSQGGRSAATDDRTVLVLRTVPVPAVPGGPLPALGPVETGPGEARAHRVVVLRAEAGSAPLARSIVRSLATTGGWDEDDVDTAELLTSELVANAVVHGRSDLRLSVSSTAERFLVEVEDGNDRLPVLLPDDAGALSGRGLHLVQNSSAAWGSQLVEGDGPSGKVVWFALHRPA